jgi:D-arginine dehydrogenase
VHQGFIRGLKSRGAELACSVNIRSIERLQGRWVLDAGERVFRAPLLIDAAGAWADEVARMAGVATLGLQPRRRSAFVFAPPEGIPTAQWPFVASVEEGFYFKPDAGLLLGSPANADPVDPHDVQPEELDIAMAIHRIEEATTMRIARPIRAWAGLRSFVSDGNIVSGFAPDAPDFFWLAALGGYGIQTCAALGEASASLALRRPLPGSLSDAGITPDLLAVRR